MIKLELDGHHVQQNEVRNMEDVTNPRILFTFLWTHVFERELRDLTMVN